MAADDTPPQSRSNCLLVLVAAAVGACQQSPPEGQPHEARPEALSVRSTVGGTRIIATTRLPLNPKRAPIAEDCSSYALPHPRTAGGRNAAAKGWIVTSETKLGRYDAITFAGALDPSTSSTCAHVDGNLAIFDGPMLKALAYRPRQAEEQRKASSLGVDAAAEDPLGSAEQIEPRRIRLYYGLPGSPFADVVLGNGISVEPIAKEDRVCSGGAVVPNVFGEDIRKARKSLMARGWVPQRPAEEASGAEDLDRQGVVEAQACSGTGYAFCAFSYRHRKGYGLSVTSMGEEYRVTKLDASCTGPAEGTHSR